MKNHYSRMLAYNGIDREQVTLLVRFDVSAAFGTAAEQDIRIHCL